MSPTIVIDAGHGGTQHVPGATPIGVVGPGGTREKDGPASADWINLRRDADYTRELAITTNDAIMVSGTFEMIVY